MKSRTKVFSAFLVIATVETLSLFIRAGVARAEPLPSEQNFGNYIASLPIELSQEQPSEAEQRFRNFLIASLDPTLEAQTSTTEPNFGNYVAALPIELTQAQPSEAEQRFRNFLIASVDSTLEAQTSSSEQTFGNYVAALPIEVNQAQPSETEQQVAFLPLEANQAQSAQTEQRFSNFLVASLDSTLEAQTSATESNFGNYVAALPIEADRVQPSETEQQVAFLPQPRDTSRSTVERNYIYDVPQSNTEVVQPKKEELSAAVQNYSNYLVALRAQQSNEQSQSQAEPGTETTNAPVSTDLQILSPQQNAVLDVPAATITVQYPLGSQVELQANGVLVNSSLIGGTETNSATKVVTQTWYGVVLHEGDNIITAQTKINGGAGQSTSVKVQVRGSVQQLKIQTVEARIPADGRSTAKIQGQLLDKNGNRSNRDAIITLAASAGEFAGADADEDEPGFQLQAREGQFNASLRSDLKAQTVRIRATTGKLEAFTQLQFETNLRPSIVTGVVDLRLGRRGTDFFKSFREFLPPDEDNRTQLDFHTSVFATGKIGEWLFTGAYNSDRNLNQNCDGTTSVFRQDNQFCDRNYPVYGDSSKVENLTPSQDSLYLRFERNSRIPNAEPDYAMWGDYNTQEFSRKSQEFTATNRNLHGFKANYNLGKLQITALYGDNVQGFQRDTIAPDGTGGYYFLSRRLLLPGSENVAIELEELNRPGTVLDRKQLSRGPDYEIDYDRGTLLFRNPLLRTDIDKFGQVLVRRIVITYQYESQNNDNNFYGGRLQYNFSRELNSESWLGATYIKENQGVRDFELYGADAYISISPKSHLIAEYAHSKNDSEMMGQVSGSAFRLEAEGEIAKGIQGRAYLRSADAGFANNATISFVPGQTRYGAQITGNVSPTTNVRLQYDHEDNKGIAPQPIDTFEDLFAPRSEAVPGSRVDNSLTTITAGVQQRIGKADLTVDLIHRSRKDRIDPEALSGNSDQLRSRLNVPITDNLTFLAQNELSFSSDQDAIYPDRTILGLDWKVASDLSIRLAQQFYTGGQFEGNSITSLDFIGEHKFGKDTTMTGRYSILGGADGISTQGAIGINQGFTISPGLKLSLAYEHVFGDFYGRTAAGTQFAQPFAVGQSAASLGFGSGDSYSIGLDYKDNPNFQASARYEHRNSSGGSNTLISAGVTGKISPALTALLRYQQASSSNQKLEGLGNTANLKLGLAYRDPDNDKFNALLRYEYRKNPSTIPDSLLLGTGTGSEDHTFALETLYAPNWRWELYGKYAIRHSTSYLAQDLVGSSTINLAQLRATYRLGYNFDLVGEARWLNQPSVNHSETGFVIEGGYYLTPNLRLSAGYAFGSVDDEDFSGSRSAGGLYAGLTVKLNELFDGFGLQKPAPAQQQESKVKPVASKATEQQKLKERLANHAPAQPQQQNAAPSTTNGQKLKERLRQTPAQPVQQNAMPATSAPAVTPDAPIQSIEPTTPAPAFTIAPETIPDQLGEPAIPTPSVAPESKPAQSDGMS